MFSYGSNGFESQRSLQGYSTNDVSNLNALTFTCCGHMSDNDIIEAKRNSEMGRGWLTLAWKKP